MVSVAPCKYTAADLCVIGLLNGLVCTGQLKTARAAGAGRCCLVPKLIFSVSAFMLMIGLLTLHNEGQEHGGHYGSLPASSWRRQQQQHVPPPASSSAPLPLHGPPPAHTSATTAHTAALILCPAQVAVGKSGER
jgi:hypothetical protein